MRPANDIPIIQLVTSLTRAKCLEIAQKYVDEHMPEEFELNRNGVYEWPDFIYFSMQLKPAFRGQKWGGSALHFIQKSTGRHMMQPFSLTIGEALYQIRRQIEQEDFVQQSIPHFIGEKGFCLIITEVKNKTALLDTIFSYKLEYIIPEAVAGNIYRIRKTYNRPHLEERLQNLPAPFHLVWGLLPLCVKLLKNNSCSFTLEEYTEVSRAKYTDQATAIDYEPIW